MDKKNYELLKSLTRRMVEGEKLTFAERNLHNILMKKFCKKFKKQPKKL